VTYDWLVILFSFPSVGCLFSDIVLFWVGRYRAGANWGFPVAGPGDVRWRKLRWIRSWPDFCGGPKGGWSGNWPAVSSSFRGPVLRVRRSGEAIRRSCPRFPTRGGFGGGSRGSSAALYPDCGAGAKEEEGLFSGAEFRAWGGSGFEIGDIALGCLI
jgi:hypothetical protein